MCIRDSAGTLSQGGLASVMASYGRRRPGADIWGIRKDGVTHRIYITDASGRVLLDSTGSDVGKDYSRWNDVARTCLLYTSDAADERSSVDLGGRRIIKKKKIGVAGGRCQIE